MSLTGRIKKFFASVVTGSSPTDKVTAVATITNNLVGYLLKLSDFDAMDEEDIYEQLYLWEPEIGGGIDRVSTMVGESFKYFYLRDIEKFGPLEEEMVNEANKIAEKIDVRHNFEIFAETLAIHGNVFLEPKDDLTIRILPNRYVTILDTLDRLRTPSISADPDDTITTSKYLVLYEGTNNIRVMQPDTFVHIKYKSTPIFCKDARGRLTYGIYSPSPLHRVILAVWWKRQTMITDILWRQKNVPREHHTVDAEMFSLDKYAGDLKTKRDAASTDAQAFLQNYARNINTLMPDQGYATLNTVGIEMIENRGSSYMQTNDLIGQINEQIWSALNLPKSMIAGESHSSYASELVISNYVAQKVTQMASRIKPVILSNVRKRLLLINPGYPVESLDIKIELNIAATELETYRQAAIMATLPFTETEIRESMGYKALREDQKDELFYEKYQESKASTNPFGGAATGPAYPQTAQSSTQHATDTGQNTFRKKEGTK